MKKSVSIYIALFIVCILIGACGNNSTPASENSKSDVTSDVTSESENDKQEDSCVGGWKADDGSVMILDQGGTGLLVSKLNLGVDQSDLGYEMPDQISLTVSWEEDEDTVKITTAENEVILQKIMSSGNGSSLKLDNYVYTRLNDEETQEYRDLANSSLNIGGESASDESAGDLTDITISELAGEWYDVSTGKLLILNADSSYEWDGVLTGTGRVKNGVLDLGAKFFAKENDGIISLVMESDPQDIYISSFGENCVLMRFSDLPAEQHNVGETASNSSCDITLTDVSFTKSVPTDVYDYLMRMNSNEASELELTDGSVYTVLTYTYKNKQKSAVTIGNHDQTLKIAIDYADGFIFSTESGPYALFTDGTHASINKLGAYNGGVSMGDDMILQPLEEREFKTYIKCASDVETDTESPLIVTFTTSSGSRDRFIVR